MCKNGLKDISEKDSPIKVIFDGNVCKNTKYLLKKEERKKEPADWDSLSLSI